MSSSSPSPVGMTNPKANLSAVIRLCRGLALLGLTLGLGLVGSLFLFTLFPSVQRFFGDLVNPNSRLPELDAGLPVALALLMFTPLAVGYAYRRLRPLTLRRGVVLGLIAAAALVANLVLVAVFSSVREGLEAIVWLSFWKANGAVVGLAAFTLLAIGAVAWWQRPGTLRDFVRFGLAVGFILTLDLVLVAVCPVFLNQVSGMPYRVFNVDYYNNETFALLLLVAALIALTPLAVLAIAWRLRLHSWRWIGGGYLVLAPLLAYLAADDPVVRRPVTMEEIAPAFPGAEQSFAVLMRYGSKQPAARDLKRPDKIYPSDRGESIDPSKPAEWNTWLIAHRRDIEAAWTDLAPVRAWWHELNSFDRIGDLTLASYDSEMVAWAPIRLMTQVGCGIAGLQANDGHYDEAVETLLPVLQVGRKLQLSSRTLVRMMVAITVEKVSMQAVNNVLDRGPISATTRARLIAALSAPGGGPAGARRLIATEYAFSLNYALGKPLGELIAREGSPWLQHGLNAISPFVLNPRATFNLSGDFHAEEQELIANRQFDRLAERMKTFSTEDARPRFKNFAGMLLIGLSPTALSKVGESYWKTQDARAELLARLTKP